MKKFGGGQKDVNKELAEAFNRETKDCSRMGKYTELLQKSIDDLVGKKEEVGTASLFHTGGTAAFLNKNEGLQDFELVTFLVLKEGET